MARPRKLTPEQEAELRSIALEARAVGPRGYGNSLGAFGPNATEVIMIEAAERFGVEFSQSGMLALLRRLGLVYEQRSQGGFWVEGNG
jgi:transposase